MTAEEVEFGGRRGKLLVALRNGETSKQGTAGNRWELRIVPDNSQKEAGPSVTKPPVTNSANS